MDEQGHPQEIRLKIKGMTWMGWEPKVVKALEELIGIEKVIASFSEKTANVRYNKTLLTPEEIYRAFLKAGYVATPEEGEGFLPVMDSDAGLFKKDRGIPDLICYCFGYSKIDIENDIKKNGHSIIMEKIMEAKKLGTCDCASKNPKGRWCLPDVRQVVEAVKGKWFGL